MRDALVRADDRSKKEALARYRICGVCGQIFDEHDGEQLRHHNVTPHEPLLTPSSQRSARPDRC